MSYNLITILGPTASGKTRLSAELACEFNGEIISADSRQVYKQMNIGTGKDIQDYIVNEVQIKYHMIDIVEPEDEFNLYKFHKKFYEIFEEISYKNKLPFLVGGTGLYLNAVLRNYSLKEVDFSSSRAEELSKLDPNELRQILLSKAAKHHNTTDLLEKDRIIKAILISETDSDLGKQLPEIKSLVIGIKPQREEVKRRITERLNLRLKNGMIEEVEELVKSGLSFEKLNFFGLEYRYVGLYLKGELNYNDMSQKLRSAIHDFAKRQMTWFRKMEREGVNIYWLESPDFEKAKKIIQEKIDV